MDTPASPFRITFLGTGTSYGIPMPGCDCPVCRSTDPRDTRYRTCILAEADGYFLLIDTPPDLRTFCLLHHIRHIDAVLMTHDHADHVFGFDDLRAYTNRMPGPMPVWASAGTIQSLRRMFNYLDQPKLPGTSLARVDLQTATAPFTAGPFRITPLPVEHGRADMTGWKLEAQGKTAILIPDCKTIPPSTMALCRNADLAVLDALRIRPHPTHMNLEESAAALQEMDAARSHVIHLCHEISHQDALDLLPGGITPAYDGLQIIL